MMESYNMKITTIATIGTRHNISIYHNNSGGLWYDNAQKLIAPLPQPCLSEAIKLIDVEHLLAIAIF